MFGVTGALAAGTPIAFFMVAIAYSSAGFGGGSTYSALLSQAGMPAGSIPIISLPCNIAVSGAGFLRFLRAGAVPLRPLALVSLVSMPASFVGGRLPLSPRLFLLVLGAVLLFAGLLGLLQVAGTNSGTSACLEPSVSHGGAAAFPVQPRELLVTGGLVGFVSGLAGIGGGIILSPILLRRTDASPRSVAALSSGFIFLNSLAGLAGQLAKNGLPGGSDLVYLATLIAAVAAGGAVGTTFALRTSSRTAIRGSTHILVSLAGGRLIFV